MRQAIPFTAMTKIRFSKNELLTSARQTPVVLGVAGASFASAQAGIEAFRSIPYEELPLDIKQQLRRDGTRGELRSEQEAREVYEHNVPNEAKGDVESIRSITNDPEIDWGHIEPRSQGGSDTADNGVYIDSSTNQSIGDRSMTSQEVAEARGFTQEVAEINSPGTTGDFGAVLGEVLDVTAMGSLMGAGLVAGMRMAQAQGLRDAGQEVLAEQVEETIAIGAMGGAVNASVRGCSAAVTQVVLGANPLTAGIGLMGPEIVSLVRQNEMLSADEKVVKVASISGKCAMAAGLCALGPIGFVGLAGLSVWSAYRQGQHAGAGLKKAF